MKKKSVKTFHAAVSAGKLILLALMLMFCVGAKAQGQTLQLASTHATMKSLIQAIENQTKMSVDYGQDIIDLEKTVQVSARTLSLQKLLGEMCAASELEYKISDRHIILTKTGKKQQVVRTGREQGKVKGNVVDAVGEPLIGVSVRVKGTQEVAVTDLDGNFTINAQNGDVLEFSYIGFSSREMKVNGTDVNIVMSEDENSIDEVVVTALGIKKEAKALSYNVQQIKSSDVTSVKDANFMNSLAGKVAGVEINSSSSGIGGGAKVVMRGAKSLGNNNNALYVIDGIPMPQLSGGTQPSDMYTGQGQSGDGASMVNPEDIETISVLSGAAASALYGSEAQNGVIMITTRKGDVGQVRLSYSNNTSFFSPFVMPEFQNTYGADAGSYNSWGSKLATPSSYDPADFFQTGFNTTNAVTLSVGSEANQTFISAANTIAEGMIENNKLNRYNFAIRNTTNFLKDRMHLDLASMYMNVREQNMVAQGQYFNPIVPIYLFPVSDDINKYKAYERYNPERNFKTQYWPYGNMGLGMQNPYWIMNRDLFVNHKDRFLTSAGLTFDIAKGISLAGRAKVDQTTSVYEKKYFASTDAIFAKEYGAYTRADEEMRQIYADAILNVDKYFGDFSVNANFGTSIKDLKYDFASTGGNILIAAPENANKFTLNAIDRTTAKISQNRYHKQIQSLFATAQVGWKSMIYLDLTARNDWDSALEGTDYTSIFYPSAGVSAILTEMMPGLKGKALSFLKLRGSYSEVGNAPEVFFGNSYMSHPYEEGSPTTLATYPNKDLQPERTKAWEIGLQANLWKDKINLNVSAYTTSTYNQIFSPQLSATSGYSSLVVNGGRVDNKGIEASLSFHQPIGPVDWTTSLTYTINRNKIKEMLKEFTLSNGETVSLEQLDILSLGNVKVVNKEGGSMNDLYVTTLKTDEHGYIFVDYTQKTVQKDEGNYVYAGNASPKYTAGWRNNFAFKGVSLGFLLTARVGGVGVSMTQAMMDAYGVSKATADARDNGGALVNGYLIPAMQYYQTVGQGVGSMYVYSATNVRLAEVTLGYDIPITKAVPWIKSLSLALTGRNLLMIYNKAPYDPELTASTGTYFSGIDYFMLPSMRNLGFSVKVNF